MMIEADLQRARSRLADMTSALRRLREAREKLIQARNERVEYLASVERRLADALARGTPRIAIAAEPGAWEWHVTVSDHRRLGEIRTNWTRAIRRLTRSEEKLDQRIRKLEERLFLLEYWILEKQEKWSKIDPEKLRGQVREILLAGEELSQFILQRKVELAFDTSQGAPLGHVPIHKTYKTDRKVYLSTVLLEEQPPHLLDHYRALIVHELGHLLLHLKDSDYRRLCRLMRKQITLAPGFFDIFNILLDQQLERILRDTRPEWQTWFNRLDFHTRKIPLRDLRLLLQKAGHPNVDAAVADLAQRRLIKVYDYPQKPFVAIQSGAIFSIGLPFTRLYAFYAVFANKLPLATLTEPWLREAVDAIPRDFKTLSLFEVHALAVEVYRILFGGAPLQCVYVDFESAADGRTVRLAIPGGWSSAIAMRKALRESTRPRQTTVQKPEPPPVQYIPPQANPEGDPPPPPPPPPPPRPEPRILTPRVPPQPLLVPAGRRRRSGIRPVTIAPRRRRTVKVKVRKSWNPSKQSKAKPLGPTLSKKQRKQSSRVPKTPKPQKPSQGTRTPPLPPSPQKKPPKPKPQKKPPTAQPPREQPRPLSLTDPTAHVEQLAQERLPNWSPEDSMAGLTAALDRLMADVRAEMAEKRATPPSHSRLLPEGGKPSDQRNETDLRDFPPIQRVLTLPRDLVKNEQLLRQARPLVSVLRPYLSILELDKQPQERLMVGRRLLSSGLTRHLAYGETRLFADLRLTETDLHRDVLVNVLIDTSASMQTDERLSKAQRLAVLLAECLRDCVQVEAMFVAYNQNVYTCGGPDEHTLASLAPNGKTNESGALAYLRDHHLHSPRRRKLVLVLTDGLPTDCSVESVRFLVRSLEKDLGVRFLYGALSSAEHPAYGRRVDLTGPLAPGLVRALGKALANVLA